MVKYGQIPLRSLRYLWPEAASHKPYQYCEGKHEDKVGVVKVDWDEGRPTVVEDQAPLPFERDSRLAILIEDKYVHPDKIPRGGSYLCPAPVDILHFNLEAGRVVDGVLDI